MGQDEQYDRIHHKGNWQFIKIIFDLISKKDIKVWKVILFILFILNRIENDKHQFWRMWSSQEKKGDKDALDSDSGNKMTSSHSLRSQRIIMNQAMRFFNGGHKTLKSCCNGKNGWYRWVDGIH